MKDLNSMIKEYHELFVDLASVAGELRNEHKIDIMNYSHMGDDKPNVHVYRGIEEVADALSAPLIIKDSGISGYPIEKKVIVDDIIYYEIFAEEEL